MHGEAMFKKKPEISVDVRIDEMCVIVGREIVGDIIPAAYCHPTRDENCTEHEFNFDTNYGGTSLGLWIQRVGNPHTVHDNKRILHYNFNYNIHQNDVCSTHLL